MSAKSTAAAASAPPAAELYTAQVGPDNAAHLSAITGTGPKAPIEDIGEGSVQINDMDALRKLGPDDEGHITDDEDGLQIWVGGDSYPIFDDLGRAVADAWGQQTAYGEAKQAFDRAERLYGAAVAKVVELAGSVAEAAGQIGIDEAEVTRLQAVPQ
ncbi:MAG TPA: hypothetical protein VGF84_15670 [Micromonosporaceae bacterium]|jgi:hypothetical protein